MNDIVVSIRCLVYNHEPYLKQCLEGIVMQKTDFKFEAIVHDDASTDKSAIIIKEYAEKYPAIIKPIFEKENQYSKRDGSLNRIMNNSVSPSAKYIAICEGDDYWIDPYKLQKQVDFLEKNPDYGLVCSDINYFINNENRFINNYFRTKKIPIKYTFEDFLINAWFIAPCTWVFRKEYMPNHNKNFIVGDLPILLEISSISKIKFIDTPLSVYRVLKNSASHLKNFSAYKIYNEGIYKIQEFYALKNNKEYLLKTIRKKNNRILLKIAIKNKEILFAVSYFFRSI